MENGGGEGGVDLGLLEDVAEVLRRAGAARTRRAGCGGRAHFLQLHEIVTLAGAVTGSCS